MTDGSMHVQVTFRKGVSDGNYGSDVAEATLSRDAPTWAAQADLVEIMLREARALVHAELARSPSSNVRRALKDPWKKAQESAEYELAAGLRDNARIDEPDELEDLPL